MSAVDSPPEDIRLPEPEFIDIALSGGGFRATLFHLGIIGFLRDAGLLDKLGNICSVSGGSVLAAHLVSNWDDYTSHSDDTFAAAVSRLVSPIQNRDVSGAVLKRSKRNILRLRALNSEHLVEEYRQILLDSEAAAPTANDSPLLESETIPRRAITRWEDLVGRDDLPALHILATHLNTGAMCVFSKDGFSIVGRQRDNEGPEELLHNREEIDAFAAFARATNIDGEEIARAVAASSAFPPAFSPVRPVKGEANSLHLLTDGGVYDNSGVNYLRELYDKHGWNSDPRRLVIVSDAGRAFSAESNNTFTNLFALAFRVADAQGNRIAESDIYDAHRHFDDLRIPVLRCSIHTQIKGDVRPDNHSTLVQKRLGEIRTELDRFSKEEVFVLYRHGYLVAFQEYSKFCSTRRIQQKPKIALPLKLWSPVEGLDHLDRADLEKRLTGSNEVRKLSLLGRRFKRLLLVASLLLLLIGAFLGAFGLPWIANRTAVRPKGELSIVDLRHYDSTWGNSMPVLSAVLSPEDDVSVFQFTSEELGSVTARPLARKDGRLAISFSGVMLSPDVKVYLFLEHATPGGNGEYVNLHSVADGRFAVPSGSRHDRVRGLIITPREVNEKDVIEGVSLDLE